MSKPQFSYAEWAGAQLRKLGGEADALARKGAKDLSAALLGPLAGADEAGVPLSPTQQMVTASLDQEFAERAASVSRPAQAPDSNVMRMG